MKGNGGGKWEVKAIPPLHFLLVENTHSEPATGNLLQGVLFTILYIFSSLCTHVTSLAFPRCDVYFTNPITRICFAFLNMRLCKGADLSPLK